MGVILELARAKQKIKDLEQARVADLAISQSKIAELNADIADLLEQMALGIEKPSPPDIVKRTAITVDDATSRLTLQFDQLNIPFTKPAKTLHVMEIPDTNSMDGLFDYGNNNLYLEPADEENHKIMVDWIAKQWLDSKGLLAADVVYRIMANDADAPSDFSYPFKPSLWYAIHRLVEVGTDAEGRFFWLAGINNLGRDPYMARDKNLLWINLGTIN